MNATCPLPLAAPLHDDTPPAKPLRLVRAAVSADRAALSRLLGRGRMLALADGTRLQVAPADRAHPEAEEGGAALMLHGVHGALLLTEGGAFVRALTGLDLDALDALEAAAPARRDWLQASLVGRLNRSGSMFGALHAIGRGAVAPAHAVTLRFTLDDGSHAVSTLASATAATWCALLADANWQALRTPLEMWHALAIRTPVRFASHTLARTLLASLRPGDVVLPHMTLLDVGGAGRLRLGGRSVAIRCGGAGTIEILTLETAMDESMQDLHVTHPPDPAGEQAGAGAAPHGDAAAGTGPDLDPDLGPNHDLGRNLNTGPDRDLGPDHDLGPDLDLDRVTVRLDFSLGALALTLGQLRTLAPGTVLQLPGASSGAVAIGCGDQVLGEGEAVDVAGRLGIRITRWIAPC